MRHTILVLMASTTLLFGCGGGSGGGGGGSSSSGVEFCVGTPGTLAWETIGCPTHNSRGAVNGIGGTTLVSAASINTGLAALGITTPAMQAVYDVTITGFWYSTVDTAGNIVLASGRLAQPVKANGATAPLLGLLHGTTVQDSLVPSHSTSGYDTQIGIAMASYGYVVAMPDYLGQGYSNIHNPAMQLPMGVDVHPYLHANTLASATVDMLRAVKTFLRDYNTSNIDPRLNGLRHNGQLFLAGYSEGGFATLAAQRVIEGLGSEFNLVASEPAAGPYDLTTTVQAALASASLPTPNQVNVGYLAKAYDSVYYSSASRLNEIFQTAPVNYASRVNTLYDGTHTEAYIASQLTTVTADLFNTTFLTNFNGAGEATLKGYIAANNVYNWRPTRPTRLFHGDQDEVVAYANTTTAFTTMTANLSTSVTVAACAGVTPRNHVNCFPVFFTDMKNYFGGLALNL